MGRFDKSITRLPAVLLFTYFIDMSTNVYFNFNVLKFFAFTVFYAVGIYKYVHLITCSPQDFPRFVFI